MLNGIMAFLQDSFDASYVYFKFEQFEIIKFEPLSSYIRK